MEAIFCLISIDAQQDTYRNVSYSIISIKSYSCRTYLAFMFSTVYANVQQILESVHSCLALLLPKPVSIKYACDNGERCTYPSTSPQSPQAEIYTRVMDTLMMETGERGEGKRSGSGQTKYRREGACMMIARSERIRINQKCTYIIVQQLDSHSK